MMQGKLIVKNNILICEINGCEINIGYCINQKTEEYGNSKPIYFLGNSSTVCDEHYTRNTRIFIEYEACQIEPTILAGDNEMKLFAGINKDLATEISFKDVEKLKLLL